MTTGYCSWRNIRKGSWFISSLCEALQEQAGKTDLMDMPRKVSQIVSSMPARKSSVEEAEAAVKQCLETSTTFTKKLYFNPSRPFDNVYKAA